MTPKEIAIGLLFIMGICMFLLVFIFAMSVLWHATFPNTQGVCIEREMYCPDYSDMRHSCQKEMCHISEDARIINEPYSLYANRSQIGGMKFSIDELPQNATIDSVCFNGVCVP